MTTLRVLLDAAPAAERAEAWALFNADGSLARTGRDRLDAMPAAEFVEVVVGSRLVRIASVALPPLPPARVAAAAAFALEDEFAGPSEAQHLAVSARQADGRVRVVIVARAAIMAMQGRHAIGALAKAARLIAEPELAAPTRGWRWCAGPSGAFLRFPDGGALAMSPPDAATLPAELEMALSRAARDGTPPAEVRVDAKVAPPLLAQWAANARLPFTAGTPWRWHDAPAASFAAATDLLQGDFARAARPVRGAMARRFVPALAIAATAIGLHVVATVGEWAWLKYDAARMAREWVAVAEVAGIPASDAATPSMARESIARRTAALRHARGLDAPEDALPLLARAAPAIAALPPLTLKSAIYADGHWTLDLAHPDAATMGEFGSRLKAGDVVAIIASTAAGTRVRIGAP